MEFQKFINKLNKDSSVWKPADIVALSGLTKHEIKQFKLVWPKLTTIKKYDLVEQLIDLEKDSASVDFSSVLISCIHDDDIGIRKASLIGLSQCEDRSLIKPLIEIIENDASYEIRIAAIIAISGFVTMYQAGKLGSGDFEKIRKCLFTILSEREDHIEVQCRAIEVVGGILDASTESIIKDAYGSGVLELKKSSIRAMALTSDIKWVQLIIDDMEDQSAEIRYESVTTAGMVGDETIVPYLIDLLQDDDSDVQLAAISSLGMIGGMIAKMALNKCLEVDDFREAAELALGNIAFDDDPMGVNMMRHDRNF